MIFSRPGRLIRSSSPAEVLVLVAAISRLFLMQMLLTDEFCLSPNDPWLGVPVRKWGREKVMDPMPMTNTPEMKRSE